MRLIRPFQSTEAAPSLGCPANRRGFVLLTAGGCAECQILLDFSCLSDILNGVDNYVWSGGACSRFSFFGQHFSLCYSKTSKIASFRINQLRIAPSQHF